MKVLPSLGTIFKNPFGRDEYDEDAEYGDVYDEYGEDYDYDEEGFFDEFKKAAKKVVKKGKTVVSKIPSSLASIGRLATALAGVPIVIERPDTRGVKTELEEIWARMGMPIQPVYQKWGHLRSILKLPSHGKFRLPFKCVMHVFVGALY